MVIEISQDVKERLERLAAERGATASDIIAEALDALEPSGPETEEQAEKMRRSIEEVDREDVWFTADEVRAHLDERFADLDTKYGR